MVVVILFDFPSTDIVLPKVVVNGGGQGFGGLALGQLQKFLRQSLED